MLSVISSVDHFFATNPKDYYFIDPDRRLVNVEKDRYNELVAFMMEKFHKHNTKIPNMVRRGWARRKAYARDFNLLFGDLKKSFRWLSVK